MCSLIVRLTLGSGRTLLNKRDLDHLAMTIRADLRGEMNAQLRSIYTAMIATMLGTATLSGTLAFVAARAT